MCKTVVCLCELKVQDRFKSFCKRNKTQILRISEKQNMPKGAKGSQLEYKKQEKGTNVFKRKNNVD